MDPGVRINGAYCRDVLLTDQLLPVMHEIYGSSSLRESQPSGMGDTRFISPDMWHPTVQISTRLQ